MDKGKKIAIIGGAAILGIGALVLLKDANTGGKMDISLSSFNFSKTHGLNVVFSATIKISNPTNNSISISKPYLKVAYEGTKLGNTPASKDKVMIKALDVTEIQNILVEFPATNYLSSMPDIIGFLTGKITGDKTEHRKVDVTMLITANGIPIEKTQSVNI